MEKLVFGKFMDKAVVEFKKMIETGDAKDFAYVTSLEISERMEAHAPGTAQYWNHPEATAEALIRKTEKEDGTVDCPIETLKQAFEIIQSSEDEDKDYLTRSLIEFFIRGQVELYKVVHELFTSMTPEKLKAAFAEAEAKAQAANAEA